MKTDPILRKATILARCGKYEGAIRILEPEINRYHGSFRYYYLLGACYLHTGNTLNALTYFRLALEIKNRDPLTMLGMAALYLRRGETDRAVDYYLDIQELAPKNKTAKKALTVIRKHSGPDAFSAWLESGKLPRLYPPIPRASFSARAILVPAAAAFAALLLCSGVLIKLRVIPNPFNPRGSRPLSAEFSLTGEDRNEPVQTGGSYRYILTRGDALDAYNQALGLFTAYRDEAARIRVNRILESNASENLKNKARLLLGYLEVPGFDNFRRAGNVSYSEAIGDPVLYRGVHVIWRGMATNAETSGNITRFDFLVGYDTRKTLEGIVPVVFDRAVALNPERPLEVLGAIVPVNSGSGETIRLEGVAIHQSGRLENQP